MNDIHQAPVVAIDTETTGLDAWRDSLLGYSLATDEGAWYIPFDGPESLQPLRLALSWATLVIGHNLNFDLHVLARYGVGYPKGQVADTMIAAWLSREDRPLGLKSLARVYLDAEMVDFADLLATAREARQAEIAARRDAMRQQLAESWERIRHLPRKSPEYLQGQRERALLRAAYEGELEALREAAITAADVDPAELARYAALDARATYDLYPLLYAELEEAGLVAAYEGEEMPYSKLLYEMEETGVALDLEACERLRAQSAARVEALRGELVALAGGTFNPDSPTQLRRVLYERLRLKPIPRRTETGEYSVDDVALSTLRERYPDVGLLGKLLEYRAERKLLTTYFEALPRLAVDGVLHTHYNQCGTVTGRLSSSDPNLQNIPSRKEIRNLFVARPGRVLLVADYSQAELRMVAHVAREPTLLRLYREGADVHQATADAVGCDRKLAKALNFGLLYRMGWRTLQTKLRVEAGIRLSDEEARSLRERWYRAYGRINEWQEEVIADAREAGYTTTIYGRRRHLRELYSDDPTARSRAERQAINVQIQGAVSTLIKRAQLALRIALARYNGQQLLQVHDEIVAEVDASVAKEAAAAMRRAMVEAADLLVPFDAEVHVAERWGDAKG